MADIRIKYKVDKGELVLAKKELERINKELGIGKDKANQSTSALKGVGTAIVAAFTVDKIIDFGRQVVAVTAEFQKLQAVLTNTLGSKSAADAAFTRIQDFASKTPFAVSQLTASFVKLANQGFVPTNEELRKLGDLAASTGKDFDQLTEAIIDAQVGEFERLKEFGIRASKQGDQVTFAFKGVETQTEFTQEAIRDYLLTLGDLEGVSGSMAAISKTLGGQISNLGDSVDSLLYAVGQELAPAFGAALSAVNGLIGAVTNFIGVPTEEKLKREQTELNVLVGAITQANISQEARNSLINQLNAEYPDFLANLDREKVTNEELAIRLKSVNEQFIKKIALTQAEERLKPIQDKILDTIDREAAARKEIARLKEAEKVDFRGLKITQQENEVNRALEERAKLQLEASDQLKSYTETLDLYNTSAKDYFEATKEGNETTDETIDGLSKLSEAYGISLIDVIRLAQEELHKLGDNEATLGQIEEFLSDMDESFMESDEKMAERELAALERYRQYELLRQELSRQTAEARIDLESEVASGVITIAKATGRELIDTEVGVFIFEKVLAAAQVLINLQRELSAIALYASQNPLNVVTGGLAGAAILATQGGLAKKRATRSLVTIAAQGIAQGIAGFKDGVIDLKGPGTTTSDDIPAMLSRGESVLTARETSDFMPTLKAIRENRIDPELLNSIARGGSGGHSVINQVIEVPRDELRLDLDGFSLYQKRKNQRVIKKESRYRW